MYSSGALERAVDEDEGADGEEGQEDLEEDPRRLAGEADDPRVGAPDDRRAGSSGSPGPSTSRPPPAGSLPRAVARHDPGSSSSSSPNPRPTSSTKTSSRLGSDFARPTRCEPRAGDRGRPRWSAPSRRRARPSAPPGRTAASPSSSAGTADRTPGSSPMAAMPPSAAAGRARCGRSTRPGRGAAAPPACRAPGSGRGRRSRSGRTAARPRPCSASSAAGSGRCGRPSTPGCAREGRGRRRRRARASARRGTGPTGRSAAAGEVQLLALAGGQRPDLLVPLLGQAGDLDELVDARQPSRWEAVELAEHPELLAHVSSP